MNKPFRIPTLFAIPVVIGIVGVMAYFNRYFSTPTQADSSVTPQNIRITNVTDSSFSLSWTTEKPTTTFIQLQTDNGKALPFFDDRSQTGGDKYITHSVTVRGLSPNSTYTASIISAVKGVEKQSRTVQTFRTIPLTSNQLGPTYGTVTFADGKPAEGALVYLSLPNSQLLSTIVTSSGSFLIPLNLIRTENGDTLLPIDQQAMPIQMTIIHGNSISEIQTDTDNDAPVSTILLGTNRTNSQAKQNNTSRSSPIAVIPTKTLSTVLGTQTTDQKLQISLISPPKGAKLTEAFPVISGRGIPQALVSITLGIKTPFVVSTRVKTDGTWMYSPTKPLDIGPQQVTITTTDEKNKPVAFTHQFEIFKSGTQVLGDATASATPVFRLTPTPFTTIAATPSQTIEEFETPTPEIPETATSTPTMLVLAAGILFVLLGLTSFTLLK